MSTSAKPPTDRFSGQSMGTEPQNRTAQPQDGASETFTIAELAEAFGLTHRTLRHYEDEGLITPARKGTRRIYSRRDRARIALICRGRRLGFALDEIRDFLSLYDVSPNQIEQMRYLLGRLRLRAGELEEKRHDIETAIAELREIEGQIVEHLARHDAKTGANQIPPSPGGGRDDGSPT